MARCQLDAYAAAAGLAARRAGSRTRRPSSGQVGDEFAGWFQFQPIWERISAELFE